MEGFDIKITDLYGSWSSPPPSPSPSPSSQRAMISPCAACKTLRRRCDEKCLFAPYFPPSDLVTFAVAHRVFGASNIAKFLQELPTSKRADAVSSMVYEAGMRIRDPVYGCAGVASQLHSQITHLERELASARAEIVKLRLENSNLVSLLYKQTPQMPRDQYMGDLVDVACNFPDNPMVNDSTGSLWEHLWI